MLPKTAKRKIFLGFALFIRTPRTVFFSNPSSLRIAIFIRTPRTVPPFTSGRARSTQMPQHGRPSGAGPSERSRTVWGVNTRQLERYAGHEPAIVTVPIEHIGEGFTLVRAHLKRITGKMGT